MMKRIFFAVALISMIGLFSGCGSSRIRKIHYHSLSEVQAAESNAHLVQELEAKLSDIPLPFHTKPAVLLSDPFSSDQSVMLSYSTSQSMTQLIDFYVYEMELQGWSTVASCCGKETFFFFEKPFRWASILIKNSALDHEKNHDQELFLCFGKKLGVTADEQ